LIINFSKWYLSMNMKRWRMNTNRKWSLSKSKVINWKKRMLCFSKASNRKNWGTNPTLKESKYKKNTRIKWYKCTKTEKMSKIKRYFNFENNISIFNRNVKFKTISWIKTMFKYRNYMNSSMSCRKNFW